MKRNLFKKLAAAAGAAVMALTLVMPMGAVHAADDDTGSVTITKLMGDQSAYEDLDTNYGAEQATSLEKLNGVKFSYVEVGTRVQVDVSDSGTEMLYTITDSGFVTALGLQETDKLKVDGQTYYRQSVLNEKIKSAKDAVINYVKTNGVAKETPTSGEGQVTFNNLSLDKLYVFAETDASGATKTDNITSVKVTKVSVPFFVSLPFTGKDGAETTHIYAYPKNSTGTVDITKEISKVGEATQKDNTTKANANIGDVITYSVDYEVPVPEKGLAVLKVVDTMDKGLTFDNSEGAITINKTTGGSTSILTKGTDYTVNTSGDSGQSTTITIDFRGYLNSLTKSSTETFTITYKATLNESAVLGQSGNNNNVKLVWKNSGETTTNEEPGNKTTVFTYGIDLVKKGESDTFLKDVQFTLTDENNIAVNIKKDSTDTYYIPGGNLNTITTNNQGKISIRGLAPGTYKLTETKTNRGYVLLKDPVVIKIEQTDSTTGAAKAYVNNSSTETTMTFDNLNTGSNTAKVEVTVVNNKGFDLPQTGAAGTAIFAIAGIVLVAVAGALLIFRRKTQK